ncbi:hypothetical protein QYM36_010833, partial [Artemia franciscana]
MRFSPWFSKSDDSNLSSACPLWHSRKVSYLHLIRKAKLHTPLKWRIFPRTILCSSKITVLHLGFFTDPAKPQVPFPDTAPVTTEQLQPIPRHNSVVQLGTTTQLGSDEEESSTSMSARSNSTSVSNGRKGQESMQGVSASPGVSKRVFARKVALTSGNPTPNVTQKVRCRSPDNGTPIPTRRSVEKHTKSGEDMMSRSFDPTALQSHLKAPEKQAKKNGSDSTAPNTPIKKSSVKSTDEDFSDLSDVCDSSEVVCASLTLKKEGIKTLIPHPQSRNPVPKSPNNTIPRPKRSISVQPGRASSKLKSPSPPKEKEECLESDNRSLRLPKVPPRSALPQSKHSPKVGTVEDNAAIKIQKVWRGYQTRNLDPKVSGFKQEIRQSRAEKHILNIYDQLRLAKKELEEEKRLRNEQSRLNDELKAEIQELTNKMAAPDSAPSSNVLQLSETCYQLQKQVEQLQLCMENLTKSLELVAKASVSPRPTTLEFVKEATCSELPSSDDVSIDVRSFASTMVKQLIQEAVTGLDGVSSNHLRNGSPLLIQHMQLLFQMCIDSATVPKSFCTGVVTNMLKKGKTANECGGYRPITVSSTLSKVLEKLVLCEVISKYVIDYRQFGFRKHLSCAFAHRLLKRILAKADSLELSVHICSVTKQISDGLRFDTCDLSLISYADDLLMLSFSLSVLKDNLDELVSGYSAIGLQVNGQKTEFLVFSSAKQEAPAPTVSVDGAIIAPSSSLKYLGLR